LVYNDEQFVAPPEEALVVVSASVPGGVMGRICWFEETIGAPEFDTMSHRNENKNVY
jgi:hypothetical protein